MKITKKLRDVTPDEYSDWYKCRTCIVRMCSNCPFKDVECAPHSHRCWVSHKDLFIDKFLDQTIEVEAPDVLTKKEKEYLSAVIKPFRDKVVEIVKYRNLPIKVDYISIYYINRGEQKRIQLPEFEHKTMYKGMALGRPYKLEELGL